ncbi:hypothetical protein F7734_40185 [Scytonema sp. UIC 10036]|uniref:hypothetical protein n=1 Tax=Scytonema sp. UIC 10036 TaxID=2304196 RepID=UPI0012DAD48B|nr:hypothetical protein [Scytonema sp. UIC 10036]MUG98200.1 hypothetical protein [Scytonema sp. UIC 10036]
MTESSDRPTEFDAVLGGQTSLPRDGIVLGGIEGLQKRFAAVTGEQRVAYLANALQFEDAGVDFLIEAMNDEELIVRATAYKLLHSSNSIKAQQAINNGILLNKGDKVYCVYESTLSYNDESYYIEYLLDFFDPETEEYREVHGEKNPLFISRHLFQENAELEVITVHQTKLLTINIFTFTSGNYYNDFVFLDWCKANKISLKTKYNENHRQFQKRVFNKLQNDKNLELLSQFWNLMCLRQKLAFVREEVIQENQYFDFRGNNFQEVF